MKNYGIFLIAGIFAFVTDQWSKSWAVNRFTEESAAFIPVISPFFNLQYAENRGMNFGLLSGQNARWFLVVVTLIIVILVINWARRFNTGRVALASGLLVGGAIGNIYDRIVQGFVTDFINNSLPNWHNPFSYNVADIWIFVGLIGLIFWAKSPHVET